MRSWTIVSLIVAGASLACGGMGDPVGPSNPTVAAVTVSGSASLTALGQTSQLTANATLLNGTSENVTTTATWKSSNPAVATVSSAGLVTAVNFGQTTITATYENVGGAEVVMLQPNKGN